MNRILSSSHREPTEAEEFAGYLRTRQPEADVRVEPLGEDSLGFTHEGWGVWLYYQPAPEPRAQALRAIYPAVQEQADALCNSLGEALGHEPCAYTLKASTGLIIDHLLGLIEQGRTEDRYCATGDAPTVASIPVGDGRTVEVREAYKNADYAIVMVQPTGEQMILRYQKGYRHAAISEAQRAARMATR